MSWRQFVRALEKIERDNVRQARHREREAMRNYRAMVRSHREHERLEAQRQRQDAALAKQLEQQRAADEVSQYERYVELLVSLHKECSEPWHWEGVARSSAPVAPVRGDTQERAAAVMRDAYVPGFFERLFGGAKKRQAELEQLVVSARWADDGYYRQAYEAYEREHASWAQLRGVGERIVASDMRAYGEALNVAGAFVELAAFGDRVEIVGARPQELALVCRMEDPEVVPSEEMSLTAKGKLSSKDMAKGRYWALYQDHVCSAAIRVAREVLAVLPVGRVVVNVGAKQINPSNGHQEFAIFLAAQFTHDNLGQINLNHIDPSDAMRNFPHRMRFKKMSGFDPIAPMDLDEQWATCG